jgi:hypothetical protein
MNGVPFKISKNIIGSMDLIEKIQSYITPTVFKQSYPVLLKLKPKLLDHIINLIWDETERVFPNYVHCKCNSKCIRKFKMSYLLKGYKRHKHLDRERAEKIKDNIRNKMTPYYLSLMKIVGDPLVSKINALY